MSFFGFGPVRPCGVGDGRTGQQQQLGKKWSKLTVIFQGWVPAQSICFQKVFHHLLFQYIELNLIIIYLLDHGHWLNNNHVVVVLLWVVYISNLVILCWTEYLSFLWGHKLQTVSIRVTDCCLTFFLVSSLYLSLCILSFFFNFTFPLLFVTLGREELLTEHAIQWNRKKIEGLPRSLAKRYNKV